MRSRALPQFCLILRGPAGAGKSTLARSIQEAFPQKVAVIDTDIFSWQIVPGEDDKELVYENIVSLASSYLRRGHSLIVEGLIISAEERGALEELRPFARSRGAFVADFTAPCHSVWRWRGAAIGRRASLPGSSSAGDTTPSATARRWQRRRSNST